MTELLSQIFARHGCKLVKSSGGEYKTNCLWHTPDKTPSLCINDAKSVYYCQSCGAKGNVITLSKHYGENPTPNKSVVVAKKPEVTLQAFCDKAPTSHPALGAPVEVYDYKRASGAIYAKVFRFEKNGKKEFRPLIKDKDKGYVWQAPPAKYRLPFNLPAARDANPVVIVEGEKAANAANILFTGKAVAITWQGGSKAARMTRFAESSACKGKTVYLWADNDDEGREAMKVIADMLDGVAADIRVINLDGDYCKGYDAADALADGMDGGDILRKADGAGGGGAPLPDAAADNFPKGLGYDDSNFYFWVPRQCLIDSVRRETNSIIRKLLVWTSIDEWEDAYGKKFSESAANELIRECEKAGYFDASLERGRGVNIDRDGIALSLGNKIVGSDMVETDIARQNRRGAIYTMAKPISHKSSSPLSDAGIAKFSELIDRLGWTSADMGGFLLGWLATAVICGALRYRPHCWITGGQGTGKTWIMDNVIKASLGAFAIYATSKTTEPGLRNILGKDSLPVIMDEAETQSKDDINNMQRIIDLARQSFSNDGASIIKGKSGGEGYTTYQARSSFLFSSINYGVYQSADLSRFIHLKLERNALTPEEFKDLDREMSSTINAEFSRAFIMRVFLRARDIIAAYNVFAPIVANYLNNSRRDGDTYGTLLAARYCVLYPDPRITENTARKIVENISWEKGDGIFQSSQSDDVQIINRLVSLKFRFGESEVNIGDLVQAALIEDGDIDAIKKLSDLGIAVREKNEILISDNINLRERVFANTQWNFSWYNTLSQSPAAVKYDKNSPQRFGKRVLRKYIAFPLKDFGDFRL